jgi:DNA-binding CsgD family transcriptional regulator
MPSLLLQRDRETAALGRQLDLVRARAGSLIVVEGPAGIGKSSLLTMAASLAEAGGMRVLRAWGGPLEQEASWGIARQFFTPVREGADWNALAVGAAALAERALDPDSAEPALGGDAMHAASHGLTWLACNLADRSPTVLIIDDAHWADPPSLRWLARLCRQLEGLALGVLCAIRSGETPSDPNLLAELLATAREAPIRPTPLDPEAVEAVVVERLPGSGRSFAHACHAVTAGNPFLLRALVDHLIAEQIEPTDDVGARLSTFGPDQVARSVERQLARLPDGATHLARAFAVLGRGAPLRQARELALLDVEEAARLADRLTAAGLLDSDSAGYALVHPLVAGALYSGLHPAERALWHRRAGRILDQEMADPERVALHLLRSEPARDGATVALLRLAAHRANLRGAPQAAAVFLRRALAEPPPERAVEAEVHSELGLALAAHVQPGASTALSDAVALAESPVRRSQIALVASRALGISGYFEDAVRLCDLGLSDSAQLDPELVTRLELEFACDAWLHASTVARARAILRRRDGKGSSALWGIHEAWELVCAGGPVAEPRALLAKARREGRLNDEADSLLGTILTFSLIACGDLDDACRECAGLIDMARPRGWLIALTHGSFLRALALAQAGRIREAEADARLAFDVKLANSPPAALIWGLFPLIEVLTELDALDEADAALAAAGRRGEPPADGLTTPILLERRARLRLAQRRVPEAHADLVQAAEIWDRLGICHPGLSAWRVDQSEALVSLGDVGAARRLAQDHVTLAERVGLPGPRAAGLRALALTADREQAVTLLRQAAELVGDSPAQLEHTRVLVALGAALRRTNRRGAAEVPLRRALDLAESCGMRRLAQRAREELKAVGARPRRSALSGIGALTPAEHRVAALAAAGQSNREIAQQLYVTRRTVETHLTHAFAKLNITTRAELAVQFPEPATASLTPG